MKRLLSIILCLSLFLALTACSSSEEESSSSSVLDSTSTESVADDIAENSAENSNADALTSEASESGSNTVNSTSENKGELEITTDDLVGTIGFDLSLIKNGMTPDEVLTSLGITESDLNSASTDSTWYIDSVTITLDGYKFYPRIDFWNNTVFVVYLCATSDTDVTSAHSHFNDEFTSLYGTSEASGSASIWTKAETRLWENQTISFADTSNCYAIEVQRVAA